jgi:hypothetical protein
MSGPINTGSIAKLLWPGLDAIWGKGYRDLPMLYKQFFDMNTSTKNYEEDVLVPGFGLAPIKPEGSSIVYDSTQQGYTSRYTHVAYGLGFIITREAIDDNQYEQKAVANTKTLARSFRSTTETVAANVYNRAFDSNFVGGDGVSLISAAHPTLSGLQSNALPIAADMSESALEDLSVQIMNATDERGLRIQLMGQAVGIPPALSFEATRILKSQLQNDTANNAVNAMRSMGLFPEGIKMNNYFTDPDAWFILTDAPDSLKFFDRTSPEFAQDNDFDTSNLKYKGYTRFSAGWSDYRGVFGSPGA